MNKNIDALSVMEQAACALRIDARHEQGEGMEIARAAVAELIEAMDKLFGADMECCMKMDGKEDQLEAVRFAKAALNRVKGD